MDTLVHISRDMMQGLKDQKDEEMRQVLEKNRTNGIKAIIRTIYSSARRIAETTDDLSYKHPLPATYFREEESVGHQSQLRPVNYNTPEFHTKNMDDILGGLRDLFPGCTVLNTVLSRGQDGKMYDISKMDEKIRPFIDTRNSQKYIVIDWS